MNGNLLVREAHQALVRLRRVTVLIDYASNDIELILADKRSDLLVLAERVKELVRLSRYERRFRGRLDRLSRAAMEHERERVTESLAS
ncbi:hypothetical protein [Blastomonas sp.]|uniref:hypothetical protein n=1 Tax=Blastomonas sp. TaxID=1909299 RepID=UPI003592F4D2